MIERVFAQENFQLAKTLLDATAMRHELLAGNLANLETPGYKRMDLAPNFEAQLRDAVQSGNLSKLESIKPTVEQDPTAKAVRADGNNVQMDHELLEINRNSLEYDFLTQYVSGSLKQLKTAITGQPY